MKPVARPRPYTATLMLASNRPSTSPALDLYKSVLALRGEAVRARSVHSDDPNAVTLSTLLDYALLDFLAANSVDAEGTHFHVRLRARDQHGRPMVRLTPAVRPRPPTDGNDADAGDDDAAGGGGAAQPRRAPRHAVPSDPALSAPPDPPPVNFKGLCRAVLGSYGVQSTPHVECAAPAMRAVRLEAGRSQTAAYKATGMPPSRCSPALSLPLSLPFQCMPPPDLPFPAGLWLAAHPLPKEFQIAHIPIDLHESLRPYLHLIMFLTRLKLVSDGHLGAAVPFSHRKASKGAQVMRAPRTLPPSPSAERRAFTDAYTTNVRPQVLFVSVAMPARHAIARRLLDTDGLEERVVNALRRRAQPEPEPEPQP